MIKVIYVGKDSAYFKALKGSFIKHSDDELEFKALWHDDPKTFQLLSKEIVKELPHICLLDYSSSPEKMMTVARTLPRLFERGPSLIGLWDYQANPVQILESKTLGIPFTHFKSREYEDLVSQALFLYKSGPFPEGDFAKADVMNKPIFAEATSLFRIGYVTTDYAHVEHDFLPPENKEVYLHHTFDENFPIDRFKLIRRLDTNYYYEMAYASDLQYVFLDPKDKSNQDFMRMKKIKQNQAFWNNMDDNRTVDMKKAKVQKYVEEKGICGGGAKRTKLMVIDSEMTILDQADKPLDNYPYSIRFFRSLHNKKKLINRVKPGILCYQCPPREEGELGDIMSQVEGMENFNPFIVVFQSSWSSEHLQKHYNYSRIISWSEPFNFSQLLTFCESYENNHGREKTHDMRLSFHDKEKRHYISKSDTASYMEYPFTIEFRAVCETWVKFQTSEDLALWSIISVKQPVPFDITIIERLDEREWARENNIQYRGVVHGLGERERANMRRAVNQMIYEQEHHDKEEAEKEKNKKES